MGIVQLRKVREEYYLIFIVVVGGRVDGGVVLVIRSAKSK